MFKWYEQKKMLMRMYEHVFVHIRKINWNKWVIFSYSQKKPNRNDMISRIWLMQETKIRWNRIFIVMWMIYGFDSRKRNERMEGRKKSTHPKWNEHALWQFFCHLVVPRCLKITHNFSQRTFTKCECWQLIAFLSVPSIDLLAIVSMVYISC